MWMISIRNKYIVRGPKNLGNMVSNKMLTLDGITLNSSNTEESFEPSGCCFSTGLPCYPRLPQTTSERCIADVRCLAWTLLSVTRSVPGVEEN